jgi:DNA polymerase-3 subunit alpha
MRMLLKKLKVEDYLTLVAASSIIRPGVAESGMMREYILRHNDPERVRRAPKALLDIMPETYGVMVYQEDVLKVAHHYAGLSLEEADTLRRGMTARFRERPEFKAVEEKFFANCKARGHPDEQAREIWRQIESFASFSFAKGHSASYAVESYQSLWLKAHHPLEFLVAVANNFGGFYSTEFYLHEAKRHGAVIEAPCVNRSGELCVLTRGQGCQLSVVREGGRRLRTGNYELTTTNGQPTTLPRIFLGLANIKSLTAETVQLILHQRERHGPFAGLEDLLRRVPLPLEQARILIRTGALRFTGRSKPQLLWDLALLHAAKAQVPAMADLFIAKVEEPVLPELHHYPLSDAYDELELLGFPLCDPFALVEGGSDDQTIRRSEHGRNEILQREMPAHIGKRVAMLGYMVHVKSTTTHHGERMTFGSFIDTAGDLWDSTQFPAVAARYPFRGRGVYRLTGIVEEEYGHCALRTQSVEKLPWKPDPRYGEK